MLANWPFFNRRRRRWRVGGGFCASGRSSTFSRLENGSPACGPGRETPARRDSWTVSSMASHGDSSRCRRRLEKGKCEADRGRKQGRHTLPRTGGEELRRGGEQRRGQIGGSFCE
ncbi:hypothetical protein PVAP13_5KG484907 [Panicum virgatum]|uniref:Uncharacterized protein n=1 Tax=Panicum virgatum TaxID=38727 RepID=A0A8T0SV35_PANVG|nr:hypothetical protein PVAP13_5KG484907 [Panicum virgatum]